MGRHMEIDLPYLMQDVDRHGNVRVYVRRKNIGKVRLKASPGSPQFIDEYKIALERLNAGKKALQSVQPPVGTLGWLAHEYESAYVFTKLDQREQRVRHLIMEATLNEPPKPGSKHRFRDCPISEFTADHVRLLRNRKQDTPAAANHRVGYLRIMLDWGMEERSHWVKRNAAASVKSLTYAKKGFHSWEVEEVRQFEKRHPVGSTARLAMVLMLYTGMRRSDAVRLGPQHVKDGWIKFTPKKTSSTTGKTLELPLLAVLHEVIKATPTGAETFLVTSRGKSFTTNGFGNWFRDRCDEAGLPQCTSHGLRKAGAKIAAENGATEKQLMAIFGWDSPHLASHYSKMASQKKLAKDAMHLLIAADP